MNNVPEDVFTEQDRENYIRQDQQAEDMTEKRLGDKFMTKIPAGGSMLERVNRDKGKEDALS